MEYGLLPLLVPDLWLTGRMRNNPLLICMILAIIDLEYSDLFSSVSVIQLRSSLVFQVRRRDDQFKVVMERWKTYNEWYMWIIFPLLFVNFSWQTPPLHPAIFKHIFVLGCEFRPIRDYIFWKENMHEMFMQCPVLPMLIHSTSFVVLWESCLCLYIWKLEAVPRHSKPCPPHNWISIA